MMPSLNGNVRDDVLRKLRVDVRELAGKGMSAKEIKRQVHRREELSEGELSLLEVLSYHAVAEAKGRY